MRYDIDLLRQTGSYSPETTGVDDDPSGRRSSSRTREFLIGAAVLVTIAVVFFGVRYMEGRSMLGRSYELMAEFDTVDGLLKGSPVTMSGIRVGMVRSSDFSPDGTGARVRMIIDHDVAITEGTTASLEGLAAFDNIKVALHPGPPENPRLEEGAVVPSAGPGFFTDLRQNAQQLTARLDGTLEDASGTFHETTALVHDARPLLLSMREATAATNDLVRTQGRRLDSLLLSLNGVSDNLGRLTGVLRDVVEQPAATGNGRSLDATLLHLEQMAAGLSRSSVQFESLLTSLNTDDGTLRRLSSDSTLYAGLDSVVMRLNSILADFERDPDRYLRKVRLIDLF